MTMMMEMMKIFLRDGNADGADLRDFLKEYLWNM